MQNRYIVTPLSSGLALIDQQRAHERILFDRLSLKQSNNGSTRSPTSVQTIKQSQTLLFPINCQFSPADADLFAELLPDLRSYGFAVEPLSQSTFVVTATPADLKEGDLQACFDQMLADYKGSTMQKFCNRSQSLCASLARQMAIKPGKTLTQEEMQQLVADLFACPMADTAPSGKKIITIIKPEELLK